MNTRRLLAAAAAAVGLLAPATASAQTFTVNTTADTTVPGGCTTEIVCSLRDALLAADAAPQPENRVEVPAGNYSLAAGVLQVGEDGTGPAITIHGAGARTTVVDAEGGSRVFDFNGGGKATVEGITITGGLAAFPSMERLAGDGGGTLVTNIGGIVFRQVAVVGNTAALNGAGISAPPEDPRGVFLTFVDSTVAGNRVSGGLAEGLGGGIYAFGDLTMINSTVAGNSVENPGINQGGGIQVGLSPGETQPSAVNLQNVTIAGNSVAAGGSGAGIAVDNPTAGVSTAFVLTNTLLGGNTVAGAPGNCKGVLVLTTVNNLSSDGSCLFTDPGSKQNVDPLLAPLADNGGQTNTRALQPGSPAIDAGTNLPCPPTDQRGVARPQGAACDIGAFELVPTAAVSSADLRLKLKAKPRKPKPGQKVTFKLKLANAGPAAATGIVIKGTVPALTKKVKGKKVKGKRSCKLAKAKRGKRKFTCRFPTLAARKKTTVKIVVPKVEPGKLRVKARVRSAVADPKPKNGKVKKVLKVAG